MKKNIGTLLFLCLFTIISCTDNQTSIEEANCELTSCNERGLIVDCKCECEDGYLGRRCERFNVNFTQKLLDDGVSPITLLNNNIPLDSIYGKVFRSGLIFHINTIGKEIKVVTLKDKEENLQWTNAVDYCENLEINGTNDWYLPNLEELEEIREILYAKLDIGNFEDDYYWSSVTVDNSPTDAFGIFFLNGNVGPIEKDRMNPVSYNFVRAVRKIQL